MVESTEKRYKKKQFKHQANKENLKKKKTGWVKTTARKKKKKPGQEPLKKIKNK